jgi:hypothetical protein
MSAKAQTKEKDNVLNYKKKSSSKSRKNSKARKSALFSSSRKKKGILFKRKKRKNKKNPPLGLLLNIKILLNGLLFGKWDTQSALEEKSNREVKLFNSTCNMMSAALVILSVFFVYIEDELIYAIPLISVLFLFIRFSKGNTRNDNSYKDEMLYVWLLRINIGLVALILFAHPNKLWAFNLFSLSIFIVPLYIAKHYGTENIDISEEFEE